MDSKAARLIAAAVLCSMAAHAQTFEVASVKPSGPASIRDSGGGPGTSDPTHFHFNSATFQDLIARAWDLRQYYQISSRDPVDRERFDVSVLVPTGTTREQFRAMLRNLLAERFHMQAHLESKDFSGYELVVAKGGAKLKESNPDAPPVAMGADWPDLTARKTGLATRFSAGVARVRGQQTTMAKFVTMLRLDGDPPILEKTGLTGIYDLTLEYAMPQAGTSADLMAVPELFEALKQQLGLQLVAKKVPLDFVVVESFDKVPSDN